MSHQKEDEVVLVDKRDGVLGYEEKVRAHRGEGKKHRAFSVFLFNDKGEVLVQKRASAKMLWPGFWANTCCSHPKKDEDYLEAANRRLKEELGIEADLKLAFKFSYQASFKNIGSENELCAVLVGKWQGDEIKASPEEIEEWQWIDIKSLKQDMKQNPEIYAPWFKIEMERIREILDVDR